MDLDDVEIDELFIETHSVLILRYFYFLIKRNERERTVRQQEEKLPTLNSSRSANMKQQVFHLLPIHHYGQLFLQLQPKLLKQISTKVDKKTKSISNLWNYWFDLSQLRNQPHLQFNDHIKIDGVRACVVFTSEKTKKGKRKRKQVKFRRRKNAEKRKELKNEKKRKKSRLEIIPGNPGLFQDDEVKLNRSIFESENPFRLLSVDPGRSDIVTVRDFVSGEKETFRHMSKAEYYHHRKTKVFARRREYHWKCFVNSHPEVNLQLDQQCLRTSSSEDFLNAWKFST